MATLTGTDISSTYGSLLKTTDNLPITSTLKLVTDGLGNNTALELSTLAAKVNGNVTATNLSGTNTGDETNATIKTKLTAATSSNDGYLTSADWTLFNSKEDSLLTRNTRTSSYTLVLSDFNKAIEFNSASATVLTVPTNATAAIPVGSGIPIFTYGIGTTTIAPAAGVTINSKLGRLAINGRYTAAYLQKRDVNEWYLFGDLA
jgi:hypothetical protein